MQFPHINKYQSLIQKHLKQTFEPIEAFTYTPQAIDKQSLQQIFSNISEINLSRTYQSMVIHEQDTTMESYQYQSSKSLQNIQSFDQTQKTARSETKRRTSSNKSLIFMSQSFSKNKETKLPQGKYLKIYYFNMPLHKNIVYDNFTKISQIITSALKAYSADSSLDNSKIKNKSFLDYQLRFLKKENDFEADMKVEPIGYDRLVIDNMFESLVLIHNKEPNNRQSMYKMPQMSAIKKNHAYIDLYNEQNELIEKIELNKSDNLQTLYRYIQKKDAYNLTNYFLVQDLVDPVQLPKDYEIANLDSNKIYIVFKKFIDESQEEYTKKPKPFKYSYKNREKEETIISNLPIGLTEASQYEQFQVIKINKFGMEQERIIGIDQHKVYNYDKSVREQKRKTSFLSKIFGTNDITGTKNPFKLISEIIEIKKTQKGIIIVYNDKQNVLVTKNHQTRQKMYRKLNYLFNYYKEEQRRINQKQGYRKKS